MSFVSIQFAIFLPVVVAVYFLVPVVFRWQFLLVSSLYCYAAPVPIFLPVLLFLGLVS